MDFRKLMNMKMMLYGKNSYPLHHWIRRNAVVIGDEEEGILRFNTNTQFLVIYGVKYLLTIVDHEKDRHKSLESDDGVEHIVKDSNNSCKETTIKKEPTKHTNISI